MLTRPCMHVLILALASGAASGCDVSAVGDHGLQEPLSIRLAPELASVYVGEQGGDEALFPSTKQFSAQVFGAGDALLEGKAAEISWSTSDETVAQVDALGRVTAKASGSVVLSVQTVRRPELRATASVQVLDLGRVDMTVR